MYLLKIFLSSAIKKKNQHGNNSNTFYELTSPHKLASIKQFHFENVHKKQGDRKV